MRSYGHAYAHLLCCIRVDYRNIIIFICEKNYLIRTLYGLAITKTSSGAFGLFQIHTIRTRITSTVKTNVFPIDENRKTIPNCSYLIDSFTLIVKMLTDRLKRNTRRNVTDVFDTTRGKRKTYV